VPRLLKLGRADVGDLLALTAAVSWQADRSDWTLIVEVGELLGHRDDSGALLSCGALFDYGAVATIGRMIVHPQHQRRGLGRALLDKLLAVRRNPRSSTLLNASPAGTPLYQARGFRAIGEVHKLVLPDVVSIAHLADHPEARTCRLRPLTAIHHAAAFALDRAAFGGDRSRVLAARAARAHAAVGAWRGDRLVGWGLAVPQGGLTAFAPVVAEDPAVALAVIAALGRPTRGFARIDVPAEQAGLLEELLCHGAELAYTRSLMVLGPLLPPRASGRLFALAGQDFA
jgi:GNAT superfamily N-acetyltransferase